MSEELDEDSDSTEEELSLVERITSSDSAFDRKLTQMLVASESQHMLTPYESNYILFTGFSYFNDSAYDEYAAVFQDDVEELEVQYVEIKYQLSLAFPIRRYLLNDQSGAVIAAYTQQSWWQATNFEASSPFRETNYEPRIFFAKAHDRDVFGWTLRISEWGFAHQSNGREELISRSWNRIYADFSFSKKRSLVSLSSWIRIPESNREDDDNPDLLDYLGYGEIWFGRELDNGVVSSMLRMNPETGYGAVELGLSRQLNTNVRLYTQLFHGYGESLIDYDFLNTRVGVGFMLNDLL